MLGWLGSGVLGWLGPDWWVICKLVHRGGGVIVAKMGWVDWVPQVVGG